MMKSGFTLVELLISMVVGFIALGIILLAMNQFIIIGPKALAKVNQASKAMLIDEKLQSQLMKMGPNVKDVSVDKNSAWSPYITYNVQVPFSMYYYYPATYRATITTSGTSIIMLLKNQSVSSAPIEKLIIASGIKSLTFNASEGAVKYMLVLYKNGVTSTFVSAVTTMNLR